MVKELRASSQEETVEEGGIGGAPMLAVFEPVCGLVQLWPRQRVAKANGSVERKLSFMMLAPQNPFCASQKLF